MVLWEIAVGTAYFLGLKKTYKLALKIQRRVITPNHPKFRQFLYRRTRAVFDMALKVHRNIQERDLEAGRTLGNWILRSLDKAKPSAQIIHHAVGPTILAGSAVASTVVGANAVGPTVVSGNATTNMIKRFTKLSHQTAAGRLERLKQTRDRVYAQGLHARGLYNSSRNIWRYRFPTFAMMMRPVKPLGINFQYRHLGFPGSPALRYNSAQSGFGGVVREDVRQWMLRE